MDIEDLELTSADGCRLRGRRWSPFGHTRADVLLAHGLAEHIGRYEHVAARLVSMGYRVTLGELRGHGHSEGRRGHVARWSDYVADLRAAAASIGGEHHILAHSTGCLISLEHLREGAARSLFMTGPLLGAHTGPTWLLACVRWIARAFPTLRLKGRFDPEQICTLESVVEEYRGDPLVFSHVTASWVIEMLAAMERVHAHAPNYSLPMRLHFGEHDRIVDTSGARRFAAACRPPLEPRVWPGLRHEILNEHEGPQVLEAALELFEAEALPGA